MNYNIRKLSMFLAGVMPYYWEKLNKFHFKKNFIGFISKEELKDIEESSKDDEDMFFITLNELGLNNKIEDFLKKIKPILENLKKEIPNEIIENNTIIKLNKFNIEKDINNNLKKIKSDFLNKYKDKIKELESSLNNKNNWNNYESIIEEFLLKSSYIEKWFSKEFKFEYSWQKIDRLLKLNKNFLNKKHEDAWFIAIEVKYKQDKKWKWADFWLNEVPQFESYMNQLSKFNISKYWLLITSSKIKTGVKKKLETILENLNSNNQSFYLWLITWNEILKFLENKDEYEWIWFDEFIKMSFIKWVK